MQIPAEHARHFPCASALIGRDVVEVGAVMPGDSFPVAHRDECVWCGARPLRVSYEQEPLAWIGGSTRCEHETLDGR